MASFALTEPDAGSDPSTLQTAAWSVEDGWQIDGNKRYITNAPLADIFMVFACNSTVAKGSRGITAFRVPRDTPGITVGPCTRGADEGVGRGWSTAMRCLAHGRVHIAALCVGMAQRLVDESVSYATTRQPGGKPIATHQLVQGLVADPTTELYAGRALVLDVAHRFDDGSDLRLGPAAAKYFYSEMVGRVAYRAVQIHGGAGYLREVAVERFHRDARLFRICEGTSQLQQVIIARQVLGSAIDG